MWTRSPRLALSRRTFHYPRVDLEKKGTNVGTIVEVGTISAYLSLSEGGCGPKLSKVGTIGCGFGPTLSKVGTIAAKIGPKLSKVGTIGAKIEQSGHYRDQIWTKIEQSGHYRDQIWPQIEQSGHYRGPIWAKWALSGVYMVQGWIWTHYRMVKMDDSSILSTKSWGQVGNWHSQPDRRQ